MSRIFFVLKKTFIQSSSNSARRFNPLTKIRVNTNEMMRYVNGKNMEESDLCMMLEDLGVVLDRSTWTHFKEVFAKSQPNETGLNKGKRFTLLKKGVIFLFRKCATKWPGHVQDNSISRC